MTWYKERRVSSFSPKVILFRTTNTKSNNWYLRIKLDNESRPYLQKSLRTESYEEAHERAREIWQEIGYRKKKGNLVLVPGFSKAFERFLDSDWVTPKRHYWMELRYNRYYKEYFGSEPVNEITAKKIIGFIEYRKTYWRNFEGKMPSSAITRNPSFRTISHNWQVLKQFFDYCYNEGWITAPLSLPPISKVAKGFSKERQTANDLRPEEARKIRTRLKMYMEDARRPLHLWRRTFMYYYFLTVGRALSRPGTETDGLKWRDCFREYNKRQNAHYWRWEVNGKLGKRSCILPLQYTKHFDAWRQFVEENTTNRTLLESGDFYVWGYQDGSRCPHHQLTNYWRKIMKKSLPDGFGDIHKNSEGQSITPYTLRSSEINNRLWNQNHTAQVVANAAGTSLLMIEKHYIKPKQRDIAWSETLPQDIYDRMFGI